MLVRSGFKNATEPWDRNTQNQWDVSIAICCDMLKRYAEYDINCILELFVLPSNFKKWQTQLKGVDYKLAVLLPDLASVLERNNQRTDKMHRSEAEVRKNHAWMSAWRDHSANIIDTTGLQVSGVVKSLEALLAT